jgi:hypothetical protein
LADYGLQEVTVVARSRAPGMGSALSSSDIMALQREEDKRRQQARQQHGTGTGLGLVFSKQVSHSMSHFNHVLEISGSIIASFLSFLCIHICILIVIDLNISYEHYYITKHVLM